MDVEAIAGLIGSPAGAGIAIDWPAVERGLGSALPDDFKRFTEAYGPVSVDGYLRIWSPAHGDVPFQLDALDELRHSRDYDPAGYPYAFWPEPGGLLLWGLGARTEHFFWEPSAGTDAEHWPTVVHRYLSATGQPTGPQWQTVDRSMTEVLAALVRGDTALGGPLRGRHAPSAPAPAVEAPGPPVRSSPGVDGLLARIGASGRDAAAWPGAPADYQALLAATGPGTLGGRLRLLAPGGPGGFDAEVEHAAAVRRMEVPVAFAPAPAGCRLWGVFSTGETCWWLPGWYDPDGWPLLVIAADGQGWQRLDLSTTAFLSEWLAGRMDLPVLRPEALPDGASFQPGSAGAPPPPPASDRYRDPLALVMTVLGPGEGAREDWTADEAALGLVLPHDLKVLHAAYGDTVIPGLYLAAPGRLAEGHAAMAEVGAFIDAPIHPEPGGLLYCGATDEVGLWWDTSRPDPQAWNLVVVGTEADPRREGLAGVLAAALTGRDDTIVRWTPSIAGLSGRPAGPGEAPTMDASRR